MIAVEAEMADELATDVGEAYRIEAMEHRQGAVFVPPPVREFGEGADFRIVDGGVSADLPQQVPVFGLEATGSVRPAPPRIRDGAAGGGPRPASGRGPGRGLPCHTTRASSCVPCTFASM